MMKSSACVLYIHSNKSTYLKLIVFIEHFAGYGFRELSQLPSISLVSLRLTLAALTWFMTNITVYELFSIANSSLSGVEKNSHQLKRNRHLQSTDQLMTPQGLLLRCDGGGEGGWP